MKLFTLGILLEGVYLALYALLANTITKNDAANQAIPGLFPWLPRLYWTAALPQELAHLLILALSRVGNINMLGLLLAFAFLLSLLAARVGNRGARKGLSPAHRRIIFPIIFIFTVVFGLTYLCTPGIISHDMFLYGLYGRMVVVYHVNPYLVTPAAFPHDILQQTTLKGVRETTLYGPVWIDLSILVALPARESIANILIGFRLLGLIAYLVNVVLIWAILAKFKSETRISGTLLYAWNPLVLLLSIAEMHQNVVIVLFVLLAIFLLQRKSLTLGWVFLLLAALINPLSLLLLPLFFRFILKESRAMHWGERLLWGIGIVCVSALVVVLAYAPYWQGWGMAGITDSLQHTFLPDNAANSLDAALLSLPLRLPPALSWLVAPHHWMVLAAVVVGGILLFGLWLADTLGLVLLFTSWLYLALLVFFPMYWPWYALLPLALAVCAVGRGTTLLAILLTIGATLSCYYLLWQPPWSSQALITIGLPFLLWGWTLFFTSTWQMTHANDAQLPVRTTKGLSRPSWISRPSWPSRRGSNFP